MVKGVDELDDRMKEGKKRRLTNKKMHWWVAVSQSLMVLSREPEAIYIPEVGCFLLFCFASSVSGTILEGENAMHSTTCECSLKTATGCPLLTFHVLIVYLNHSISKRNKKEKKIEERRRKILGQRSKKQGDFLHR